ncbi:MAG TPA: NADH-quinone oxidoreductase subunit J [bacterium]|nr:NADH-quinone oxidoreductase subunit J [bacterium]
MVLHSVLLAGIVLFALLAVFLKDLLRSAICLAVASIFLSIVFFQLGAPYAAVFELSVGAGLVMVLLASAIGLTRRTPPENEEQGRSPALILPLIALLVLAVIDIVAFTAMGSRLIATPAEGQAAGFAETLWRVRWVDILAQLGIILVGVFAILALFRKEGGLIGLGPRASEPADPTENHES